MRSTHLIPWTILVLVTGGCLSIEKRRPLPAPEPTVRTGEPARAWKVHIGDEVAGEIIHFSGQSGPDDDLFIVRNPWQQDVGLIDRLGRAYRYLPHHREPAWVGTGTLIQGARRILTAHEDARLEEVALPRKSDSSAPSPDPESVPEGMAFENPAVSLAIEADSAKSL